VLDGTPTAVLLLDAWSTRFMRIRLNTSTGHWSRVFSAGRGTQPRTTGVAAVEPLESAGRTIVAVYRSAAGLHLQVGTNRWLLDGRVKASFALSQDGRSRITIEEADRPTFEDCYRPAVRNLFRRMDPTYDAIDMHSDNLLALVAENWGNRRWLHGFYRQGAV
jgi:hypothetical protein